VLGIYMPNFLFFSRDSLVTIITRHKQAVSESFAYFCEPCFRPVVKSGMTNHGGSSVSGTNQNCEQALPALLAAAKTKHGMFRQSIVESSFSKAATSSNIHLTDSAAMSQ